MVDKQALLHDAIVSALAPAALQVIDESHMHAVPKGAQTHFKVVVVSDAFAGLALVARHRAVYAAAAELVAGKTIHALAIHAYTAHEWRARGEVMPASPPCAGGSKT